MISKALKAHSFYHAARYICEKKGAEILIADGVRGHDPKLMAEDFLSQQQMRPEKGKAGAHFILSFHPDEKPSDELLQTLAREYLVRLGVTGTQVAVVKHTDRAHLHLHILANMVDNTGNAISDSWIGLRGKKIAQQLTREYNLIPAIEKHPNLAHLEALNEEEATKYQLYQAISECLFRCQTIEDLEQRLLHLGIEIKYKFKGKTNEKQGISFRKGKYCFKGSQIDRKYSLAGLQKILAFRQAQQQKTSSPKVEKPIKTSITRRQQKKLTRSAGSAKTSLDSPQQLSSWPRELIDILLKPEHIPGGGSSPYDPAEEEKKRKKKKKRPNH